MKDCYYDEIFMRNAIALAERAEGNGEVPVGAILVLNDKIIGEGWNSSIKKNDPTAHAEIIALRQGAQKIGNYRLLQTALYVTLEPCLMCIGAVIHARIKRLIFGARRDEKINNNESLFDILNYSNIGHKIEITGDVLSPVCAIKIKNFFQRRRIKHKAMLLNKSNTSNG